MAADAENLNYLQLKAREWAQKVVALHRTRVTDSQLMAKKNALLGSAKTIKNTVEKVTGPISVLAPIAQLGALPLIIGGVAIAGAITAIAKWTYDYNIFMTRVRQQEALVADGMTNEQAHNVLNQTAPKSVSDNIAAVAKYGALALGAFMVAKYLRLIK